MDYSQPAVDLAKETTKDLPRENLKGLSLIQFNINNQARLPYRDNYFDIVFLMSVIRYIYDWEIYDILTEINRVLKLDGKLIIRATNGGTSISSKYFYNVNRILNPLIKLVTGKKLPVNEQPNSIAARLSVNIQTKESLKRHLEAANFSSKVWISYHTDVNYKRFSLVWFLGHLYYIIAYPGFVWPLSLIFGTDIWAVATKKWLNRNDREVGNQE